MGKAKSFKARIQDFEADDVRAFYDNSMLRVWHLNGKERTFRIIRVQQIVKQEGDDIEKRAVVRLADSRGVEHPLPLELNPTNRDTVIGIYGTSRAKWLNQLITIYPTECEAFGKMQACIRIRPFNPARSAQSGDSPRPRTNKQGAHVLPSRPVETAVMPGAHGSPQDNESSGLELDLPADDDQGSDGVFERNQYQSEPPPGALETDR